MAQMEDLLAVLDLRGRDALRVQRRQNVMLAAWLLLFVGLLAGAICTGTTALRYGWEIGQWGVDYQDELLTFIVIPVQSLLPWLRVVLWPVILPTPRQLATGAVALGESAARDARNTPIASDILRTLDSITVPSVPAEIGPFRRPNNALRTDDVVAGVALLLCGMALAGTIIVLLVAVPVSSAWPWVLVIGFIGGGAALCVAGIALLAEAQSLGRRVRVQADELGLRWERIFPRRREARVPWGAIRTIFVISHTRGLDRHLACIVEGSDDVLAFDLSSKTPAGEVASANRLTKLVLARSGLPLLDQTKLAESLSARRYGPQYRAAYEKLAQPGAAGLAPAPHLPRPMSKRHVMVTFVIFLLPVLLIPGFVLSGIGLQRYQQQQYTTLLAEIRAHTPLYHNALTGADADWTAHGPTSDDPNSYSFADGGYLISPGTDTSQQGSPFVEVYAPGTYRDAMVEVTVPMAPGGVPYGSAGLALHAVVGNAGGNLNFGINGDGSWGVLDLTHCPPITSGPDNTTCSYDSIDQVSAIHHAARATNKLTAILRGSQVICFINDEYVGSIEDLGPQFGRLGFGVEGLGVPVAFSNFTIYPL